MPDDTTKTAEEIKCLRRMWGPSYDAFAWDWTDDGIDDDYTGPAEPGASPRQHAHEDDRKGDQG